jgi:hypothetical protein
MTPDISKILVHVDQFTPKGSDPRDIRYARPEIPSEIPDYYGIPQHEVVVIRHLSGLVLKSIVKRKICYKHFKDPQRLSRRYPLWSCFNELLVNAEDWGSASRFQWVLDSEEVLYSSQNLDPAPLVRVRLLPFRQRCTNSRYGDGWMSIHTAIKAQRCPIDDALGIHGRNSRIWKVNK